ncbi:MAG: response regulator [Elusimicrobiota bacterium]
MMGYRILVVDDSPVLRIMLQEMLQSLGHQVIAEAASAAEAIQAFRAHKPDLVTLDISLPDKDGLTVLKELKRIDINAKVLIVTGNDQKALEADAVALKALGVLHKPFDSDELASMFEKLESRLRGPRP